MNQLDLLNLVLILYALSLPSQLYPMMQPSFGALIHIAHHHYTSHRIHRTHWHQHHQHRLPRCQTLCFVLDIK
eukprot:UN24748